MCHLSENSMACFPSLLPLDRYVRNEIGGNLRNLRNVSTVKLMLIHTGSSVDDLIIQLIIIYMTNYLRLKCIYVYIS